MQFYKDRNTFESKDGQNKNVCKIDIVSIIFLSFQGLLVVKNLPANARDIRDADSVPGSGRFPGGGHGNLLQCSCLKNSMDRGAWRTTVPRVAKSRT